MAEKNKGIMLVVTTTIIYFTIVSLLHLSASVRMRAVSGIRDSIDILSGEKRSGYMITAYCPGSCCNGKWAGKTAMGHSINYYIQRGINIAAVDPEVIPMGTRFLYGTRIYHAVDVGGLIKGKAIDILMADHAATEEFGRKRDQNILVLD